MEIREKKLGKIERVKFGFGGYQDACLGLSLEFSMKGSGVNTFVSGGWAISRSEYAKWTEEDRARQQAEMCSKLIALLNEANVDDVSKLKGVPVELCFEGMTLQDWRILTEVI